MADAYIKIEGAEGESRTKGYEKWIAVESFSWGVPLPVSHAGIGGSAAGNSSATAFHITKKIDKSSAKLFDHCCRGIHFPKATFQQLKSTGKGGVEAYLTYKFSDLMVESVQWASGGEEPHESVALNFAKVEIEYKSQGADGKLTVGSQVAYDFASQK